MSKPHAHKPGPLQPEEVPQLRAFVCAGVGPWALEVESAIRNEVADLVAKGPYGLAIRLEGEICALATWEAGTDIWYSSIVAVAPKYRRRGMATELKREVLMKAQAAGAQSVESIIAYDNTAMIEANKKLGAEIIPRRMNFWSKPETVRAIIPLR